MNRLALVALVAVVAGVGCGDKTIDGGDLEDEIEKDAGERGLVLDAVECPSPETDDGEMFTCDVTVKGQETEFEIVQTDGDGNVTYDFEALVEGPAVNDTAADEASVRSVVNAITDDITALCDYATQAYRAELTKRQTCAKAVLAAYPNQFPGPDYEVSIDGDIAAVSDDRHTATLERQKNGSWLVTDVR